MVAMDIGFVLFFPSSLFSNILYVCMNWMAVDLDGHGNTEYQSWRIRSNLFLFYFLGIGLVLILLFLLMGFLKKMRGKKCQTETEEGWLGTFAL
jgi:hypothetical protein